MSSQDQGRCQCSGRRSGGIFRTCFAIVALYLGLVFGGGTLANMDHPVAVELGRLIQVVTFVEPTINWADRSGHDLLAAGLTRLAAGAEIS